MCNTCQRVLYDYALNLFSLSCGTLLYIYYIKYFRSCNCMSSRRNVITLHKYRKSYLRYVRYILFSISISVTSSKYIKYIRDIIFWLYRLSQSVVFRKFFFYDVSIFKFSVYITVSLFFTWLFKFCDFWKFVHNFLIFCLSPFHTLIYFRDFEFFSRMDYIFCSLLFRRLLYHAYNRILFLRKDRPFYRSSYRFCDVLYNCLYITIYVYILYHPLLSGSRSYSIIVSKINYVLLVMLSSGVDYSRPDD